LHHHDFDETFSVLLGELTFQLDGQVTAARAGHCGRAAPPEAAAPIPETLVVGPQIGART
jgi:uncharacterized cupin superfamily protein